LPASFRNHFAAYKQLLLLKQLAAQREFGAVDLSSKKHCLRLLGYFRSTETRFQAVLGSRAADRAGIAAVQLSSVLSVELPVQPAAQPPV
jgi:hypothetical protein